MITSYPVPWAAIHAHAIKLSPPCLMCLRPQECSVLARYCERFFFTEKRIQQLSSLLELLSSPVHSSFLRMYQIVNLAAPKVSAICLIAVFCFFSLMEASIICIEHILKHILNVPMNGYQMQSQHLEPTPDLYLLIMSLNNEGTGHAWP